MIAQSSSLIDAALAPGEQLLWSGRPRSGLSFESTDLLTVPFSLMWGGFAIFWEYMAIHGGAPFFFALWGVPFVGVGLYMIFGRFFYDALSRANTWYGLTDKRVIIITNLFGNSQKTVPLAQTGAINLSVNGDRSGTITFGTPLPLYSPFMRTYRAGPPAFRMIENVKDVYDKILAAQQAAA